VFVEKSIEGSGDVMTTTDTHASMVGVFST
jgi:hypothetical protein